MFAKDKIFLLCVIALVAIASITIFMTYKADAFDYNSNKTASNATPSSTICEENPSECQSANQTTPIVNQTPVQNSAQQPITTNFTNSTTKTGTSLPSYAKLLEYPELWNQLSDLENKQVEQLQYKLNHTHVTLSNGTALHLLPDGDLIVQIISNTTGQVFTATHQATKIF